MSGYQNIKVFNEDQSAGNLFADTEAFEVFFKENFVSLCCYCQFKFGFSLEQSRDIVHNSFLKLWENRNVIAQHSPVKPFLYRIINNSSLDILKHDKIKRKYEQHIARNEKVQGEVYVLENIEFKQLRKDIQTAVSELPEQMQQIFKLCKYDGLTYREVACQMNLSVKTVENQMSRAFIKLRQKLAVYLFFTLLLLMIL